MNLKKIFLLLILTFLFSCEDSPTSLINNNNQVNIDLFEIPNTLAHEIAHRVELKHANSNDYMKVAQLELLMLLEI